MVCSKMRNLPEWHTCCKEAWLKWQKCYNFGTFPDKLEVYVKKKHYIFSLTITMLQPEAGRKWAIFTKLLLCCCWCLIFLLSVLFFSPAALMLPAFLLLLVSLLLLALWLSLALLLFLAFLLMQSNPALAGISTILDIRNVVGISTAVAFMLM